MNARGPVYRSTELGNEKQCSRCLEYWPLDTEFFYRVDVRYSRDGFQRRCKACQDEQTLDARRRKRAMVMT